MNLVNIKEQKGLLIHKYKSKVFYDNLWTPELCEYRGLVTDKEGALVSYPFTKIFNYKENGVTISLDAVVLASRKINGFMACASIYKGEVLVSTTGSLESEFVNMAVELLPMPLLKKYMLPGYSYCFEIVHPNDRHIIVEEVGAYVIGCRHNEFGSIQEFALIDHLADKCGLFSVERKLVKFGDLLDSLSSDRTEGWVVYDTEVTLKLKTPFYLVSKFLARKRDLTLIFGTNYRQYISEEFYPLCTFLQEEYGLFNFSALSEQERLDVIRGFLST